MITKSVVPEYFNFLRKEMIEFIPMECKTLLDVGCGAGAFGSLVKKTYGTEVWGIDPCDSVAGIAPSNLDHFLLGCFSDGLDLPKKYFEVITFNDSLEHFPDPLSPLHTCRDLLVPGGIIVCSVPNVRYIENLKHLLIEMDWEYEDSGIRDRTHLRFFTKKSIAKTFKDAGYKVVSVKGINRRYWWWEGKRFLPIRVLIGKWIMDMNYLQFVITATPE
ncbi:MAG: class I SAM-dependent methyltransferase [Nitrospirae bacterium]|nr:MAG: methyltransferase type 11 [Leptospirillum sp. Group IV 'UBA BS']MCL4486230.1 class I SAM-dependent methyltransferase [Nitrospirota bacterium]MCL5285413.1 class I SAM-dependent methyltransferase [Nitrospirota bacterium]